MYSNVNVPPTLGANIPPNIPPNVPPMPTHEAPVTAPAFGYGYVAPARPRNYFTLIVVLFILLIIVGASIYTAC
ncbi:YjcZ family sporulation protein [Desertibacillus haloalkaliphilus]|uniref:YjcZ family sporulation protein n=1 Tax=Desertibacillus haloalkaliphilus TaxID=1328930 RepID=UPI001C275A7A|nr:YjcZ family sporulation protein [Desertibacillus haloalkaliphilus]MBU8906138.1 YjcZ family sporulation protein [Desertibacillus haloalkaliphilus]